MIILSMLENESDKALFLSLHNKYKNLVFHVARQLLHDDTLAEESASDVWLEIANHIRDLRFCDDESTRNLIYIIAKNVSQNAYKKESRRIKPISLDADFPDPSPSVDKTLVVKERQSKIFESVEGMSSTDRDIMIMKYSLGRRPREISSLLSVPIDEVYSALRRGTRLLKKLIKEGDDFE